MTLILERLTLWLAVRLIRTGDHLQRSAYRSIIRRSPDEV